MKKGLILIDVVDADYLATAEGSGYKFYLGPESKNLSTSRPFGNEHVVAVPSKNLKSAVQAVIDVANTNKARIKRLRFIGHGSPGRQSVAGDRDSDTDQILSYRKGNFIGKKDLQKLKQYMAPDSWVELKGCNMVGDAEMAAKGLPHPAGLTLLNEIADAIGKPARAASGLQSAQAAGQDSFKGTVYEAQPNETAISKQRCTAPIGAE
jgi:hypothetical protein